VAVRGGGKGDGRRYFLELLPPGASNLNTHSNLALDFALYPLVLSCLPGLN